MHNDDGSSGAEKKTRLVRIIERLLERWAHFVADHAILLISICVILTLIGTFKVATTPNENDITGYTPYDARARDEFDVMTDFFAHNGNGIAMFLLIVPTRHTNVLHGSVLKEALRVETLLSSHFKIATRVNDTTQMQSYHEYCTNFCQINEPFVQFARSYIAEEANVANGTVMGAADRLRLDYPITTIYSRKMSIQPNFFGIEMAENRTEKSISNLKSSKMIALQIRSERKSGWDSQLIKDYEMSISNYFDYEFTSSEVRVLTLSTSNVEAEVVRAGMSLLPFLVVGFSIMAVVSSVTTFISALYMQQTSIHKFSLAIAACICPFMACGTALGALFYCGVRFGSILCVTPFLVLAIGVDDAYLMIHTWQRVKAERATSYVSNDSPGSRLAAVLIDTGPAILISAATNIFADVAGCFTSSPEITLLAYGNMSCILCDFIYQITFYAALMTIAGKFEMESEDQDKLVKRITCGVEKGDDFESISMNSFGDVVKRRVSKFLETYLSLVTNRLFQALVVATWLAFVSLSIYGLSVMRIDLSPKKLFMEDSSLREMDDLRVEYVVPHFYVANVFVTRPGDLGDVARLERLNQFVDEMEHVAGSWGPQGTNYFVRDMLDFQKSVLDEEQEEEEEEGPATKTNSSGLAIQNLPLFLEWPEYSFWKGFVQYHQDKTGLVTLDKFFMTFAIHGANLQSWPARGDALRAWRNVVDKYSHEFGLSVYSDDGIYVDLIENMSTDAWQSAVATIACMALICFLFMFDLPTVFVATLVITSVMTGILGILSLTGTDLDPIVMSALIISIGFSVDIPAHISYHYHTAATSSHVDIRDRLRVTLASVGFPALQASVSTSLCVLSLKFTSVYMSNVFVKTMILCMVLCVLHSLVLLPTIFAIFHRIFRSSKTAPIDK